MRHFTDTNDGLTNFDKKIINDYTQQMNYLKSGKEKYFLQNVNSIVIFYNFEKNLNHEKDIYTICFAFADKLAILCPTTHGQHIDTTKRFPEWAIHPSQNIRGTYECCKTTSSS